MQTEIFNPQMNAKPVPFGQFGAQDVEALVKNTEFLDQRRGVSVGGGLHTSKKFKVESEKLFEQIISLENLLAAWEEFRRGKRAKPDVADFEMSLEDNLILLHHELKEQIWRPSPYKPFYISDPKLRHIHKACVRDRVVHQAVFRILYPIFDRGFIFDSYSCRVGKGTHRAVKRLETFCRRLSKNYRQPVFSLKCDIKKFFDSIEHSILRRLIVKKIDDAKVIGLIDSIIGSFSASPGKGLPLGNVTSQLFANIYMNELDQFVKHRLKVKEYIRYTDDFVIVSPNREYLEKLLAPMAKFLSVYLGLSLHPRKIILHKLSQGVDFLGYVVLPHHIVLRTKTKNRIFKKLALKSRMLESGNLPSKSFFQSKQSYLGTLNHCKGHKIRQEIMRLFRT